MKLKFAILILAYLWIAIGQDNTCYANCMPGYCLPSNALACTDCDLGLINVNNMCIGGSAQAAPITYLKPSSKGLADALSPLNCSITSGSSSTQMMFEPTIGSTFTRSFSLPSQHIYLQIKFNAIVAAISFILASPTLLLTVFTASGQTIYTTVKSFNTNGKQVSCSNNYRAYDVFNLDEKFTTTEGSVLVEVRASGTSNVNVALSNFQLYYGNCSQQCGQCIGPTDKQCTSCRGLLAVLSSYRCMSCHTGFYQGTSGICFACPVECVECTLVNGQPQCQSCDSKIAASVNPSVSALGCVTNFSKLVEASDPTFTSSSWTSTQTQISSVTTCGYYSLIGGVSIGVAGSSLLRFYTDLPAHTTLYLYFTLFLIDQAIDDLSGFQISVDGQVKSSSLNITANQGSSLTNQCGTSAFQLAQRQSFQFTHSASSASARISFLKDYAGIRDVVLIVNNKTSVSNCFSQSNNSCSACRNGLALVNNTCSSCADGYYMVDNGCIICPITCKTCVSTSGQPNCLSCQAPLVLDGTFCVDNSESLFASDVVDNVTNPKGNSWVLYPHLQNNGITTCNGRNILGSNDIRFKFLSMKRTFSGLPAHSGVAIAFQFYQIDDYASDQSVKFILNNNTTIYKPSNLKMDLCGNSSPDAIVPVYLTDVSHTAATLNFQVKIDRMGKLGIRNLMIYLLNTPSAGAPFKVEAIPTYSVSTPPVKGLTVRLIFPQQFTITDDTDNAFQFAVKSPSSRLLQSVNKGGVAVVQNSSNNGNKELLYLLNVDSDFSGSQISVRAISPSSVYFTDSSGNKDLISQQLVSATIPRYVNMDIDSVTDRSSCRNLFNLFRGCAILGLFIGIASFLVGMSAAFDDFLLLCQLVFVHVFIQLEYNPPSVRIPFEGLHIVQFLEWFPWAARQSIQGGIIPDNLYQQSPLVYTQYFQDIVFVRMIYQALLFLLLVGILWVILHVMLSVWDAKHPSVKYTNYILFYYQGYDSKRLAFIDKMVRFAYFTVIWACVLQCTHIANQPHSFNIWNTILTIFFFVCVLVYPVGIFFYLRRQSTSVSAGTFNKRYEEMRVNSEKLYYYLVRYYKLVVTACIIGFLYAANPVIPLIILIIINLGDALLLVFTNPLGMVQQELIEATIFYPKYPLIYKVTTIIQQILFIILQILFLVLYGQRNGQSGSSYMGIGYAICVVVILLLLNGLLKLFWGFMKQAQHCYLQRQTLQQSIQKQVEQNKDPAQEHPIMENVYKSQANISKRELSRLQSKKMSHVSKIRS